MLPGLGDHGRVMRVEEDRKLLLVQVLHVGGAGGFLDAVGIVEQDAEVADAADAGFRTHGRLAGFDTRVAEGALLGLAALPVVVDLLVGAAGDAHAPTATLVLVDQHDAVVLALVDRARGAAGDAGRVEAVFAQARQVHHEGVFEGAVHLLLHAFEELVATARAEFAAEVVFPVRAPVDLVHLLAGDHRDRSRGRRGFRQFGLLQMLVVVGEGLVVVVDLRQVRVGEDIGKDLHAAALTRLQLAGSSALPATVPLCPGSPIPWDNRCQAWSRHC